MSHIELFYSRILARKELVLKRRESVKQLAQERKQKLLSSKVLHQFLWDVNEVRNRALFCCSIKLLPWYIVHGKTQSKYSSYHHCHPFLYRVVCFVDKRETACSVR